MKAAVCREFGKPLVIEEVSIRDPGPGEVKVRIAATGVCHSDLHSIAGEWGGTLPVVVGHESAGVVEEIGPGVTLAKAGDRVVISLLRCCGRCRLCESGQQYVCENPPGPKDDAIRTLNGESIRQGLSVAAFAEYTVLDQTQVVPIPDDLPFELACLLGCGVITGVGAAVNAAAVEPGSTVVVVGAGGVGLNVIQGAAICGAAHIIAIDLLKSKLDAAKQFGATETYNASESDAVQAVKDITGGRGADYVIVAVGSTQAIEQAFHMNRPAGLVVAVGIPPRKATVTLPVDRLLFGWPRFRSCRMGNTRLREDIPWLIDLHSQGRLKLHELVSETYPLERINEAIGTLEAGSALRNVVKM